MICVTSHTASYFSVHCELIFYSLRPILLFTNIDIFITKMYLDTSILAKSNMSRTKYQNMTHANN
jgi:hypothetical protein